MPLVQFVAHAHRSLRPFNTHEGNAWMWRALRKSFPIVLSAILMPNHLHLMADVPDPEASRERLARILGQWQRRFGNGVPHWQPVPPPQVVSPSQAGRVGRYHALNACRAGLVDDPLKWPWSSYRDMMGAVVDPWVDVERLLALSNCADAEAYHAFVSGDPWVDVKGTPPPTPAGPGDFPRHSLAEIAAAAAAALRTCVSDVRRRGRTRALFVAAAHAHGWRRTGQLARVCGITRKSVSELIRAVDRRELEPVWRCLGDERLRRAFEPPREPRQLDLSRPSRRRAA